MVGLVGVQNKMQKGVRVFFRKGTAAPGRYNKTIVPGLPRLASKISQGLVLSRPGACVEKAPLSKEFLRMGRFGLDPYPYKP
jgi:hypothetical protein